MRNAGEEKLYIQTFHDIRGYIIKNDLKSGDPLPTEQAMCQMLGVSRNVLREAMKSMELMGMIESCPGRGTVVKGFNMNFIFHNLLFFNAHGDCAAVEDMLDVRTRLELCYTSDAYKALGDGDIAQLRGVLEREKNKLSGQESIHAEDKAFHMAIFKPLGNRPLLSLMDAIWCAAESLRGDEGAERRTQTVAIHEAVVSALEAHDRAGFTRAVEALNSRSGQSA